MNTQANTPTSTILGATGLSQRWLAAYFLQVGLFGRDSSLSREQQAAVYSRLPAIEGLHVPVVNLQPSSQLRAIAELAESVVAGEEPTQARARARIQGLADEVIAEICTVVANALLLFGPFSPRAALSKVRTAPLSVAA
jgi:hypothetical protein